MKKVMIAVLSFLMLASVSLFVEGSGFDVGSVSTNTQNDRVKIRREDLPEAARNTLSGDAYKGWVVDKAYKLSNGEFEVELKKDGGTQTLKFDKDGKVK